MVRIGRYNSITVLNLTLNYYFILKTDAAMYRRYSRTRVLWAPKRLIKR